MIQERIKILYVITCFKGINTGNGGHYFSLKTIVKNLKKNNSNVIVDFKIIVIGNLFPVALNDFLNIKFYKCDFYNLGTVVNKVQKHIQTNRYDLIHSFDSNATSLVSKISNSLRIPLINTKPGGKNYSSFPIAKYNIFFSKENFDDVANNKFYKDYSYLIPNRVESFRYDHNRIKELRNKTTGFDHVLLRIGRIGKYYEFTIRKSIELVDYLQSEGLNVCLILIGKVKESIDLKQDILNKKYIILIDDDYFTDNAKALIPVADVIIGTGRSFMEGCHASKPLLCPSQLHNSLILADSQNYKDLLYYNFSERSYIKTYDPSLNNFNILKLFKDSKFYLEKCSQSLSWYNEDFDVLRGTSKVMEIYMKAISNNFMINRIPSQYYLANKIFKGRVVAFKNSICKNI